jgi:hypothetical protein
MRPYVKPEQEAIEMQELRRDCPFAAYVVSDSLLRVMVRQSNPARVRMAFRETRAQWLAAMQSWSPSLCQRMLIRNWKVSLPTAPNNGTVESTEGAASAAPPRTKGTYEYTNIYKA